jgi:hypothetical protein
LRPLACVESASFDGGERDGRGEQPFDASVNVPHSQRWLGPLANMCHGFEHSALASAKGMTGGTFGGGATSELLAQPG